MNNSKGRKIIKKIIFSLIPVLCLLLFAEIMSRAIYFQTHSLNTFALTSTLKSIRFRILSYIATHDIKQIDLDYGKVFMALFSKEGEELLNQYEKEYEHYFKILIDETKKVKSKLILMYIPRGDYIGLEKIRDINRLFYSALAKKYHVEYIDLTEEFLKYPVDVVMLYPEDTHLTHFGNRLVSEKLYDTLIKYNTYRSHCAFKTRPAILGDLPPNENSIYFLPSFMPIRVVTNSQGFRMNHDIAFPKKKQRILFLGDSFTFGVSMPNQHTYVSLLYRKLPGKEFINAGMTGYTIIDELSLFQERAKYVEPDITVLQVLDNDLFEMMYFKRPMGRKIDMRKPTILERTFLEKLSRKESNKRK